MGLVGGNVTGAVDEVVSRYLVYIRFVVVAVGFNVSRAGDRDRDGGGNLVNFTDKFGFL